MIITISGTAGSGKSTVAKILRKKLGAFRVYVGGMRRELARKKGMSLIQLNEYAQTHPETDVDVDMKAAAKARRLARTKTVIVEGRTQFHFLPESFKIFIKVSHKEAARRIWQDLQNRKTRKERNEGTIGSLQEMERSLLERDKSDSRRYRKYYGFDHRDEKQYDLVIDSTRMAPEQVAETILTTKLIKKRQNTSAHG